MKIVLGLLLLLSSGITSEARDWCSDHRSGCTRDWGQSHRSYRDFYSPRGYYNDPDRYARRSRQDYYHERGEHRYGRGRD